MRNDRHRTTTIEVVCYGLNLGAYRNACTVAESTRFRSGTNQRPDAGFSGSRSAVQNRPFHLSEKLHAMLRNMAAGVILLGVGREGQE